MRTKSDLYKSGRGDVTVAALLSLSILAFASGAHGQEPSEQPSATSSDVGVLEEVMVTARRRTENLQEVPLTVTAVSGDALEQQDIRTVTDLDKNIPGISFCCARGQAAFPFIRGVPGVIGYFAETPASLNGSALYFDVSSVQVLKGPQGTLFGLSTNGGAILLEPKRPSTDESGYVMGAIGDQGRAQIEGAVNFALSDSVLFRVGAQSQHMEGYVDDLSNGRDYGGDDYFVARIGMLFQPTDEIENYLVVNYYDSNTVGTPYTPYRVNPDGPMPPDVLAEALAFIEQQNDLGFYKLIGTSASRITGSTKQLNAADIFTWELTDSLTLKNVLGYNSVETFNQSDVDGSPFRLLDTNIDPSGRPDPTIGYSEELQLQGSAFDDSLKYVLGTFHSWTDSGDAVPSYTDLRDVFGIQTIAALHSEGNTHAYFAEGTYTFSAIEGLAVTAGIRRTADERSQKQDSGIVIGDTEIPTGSYNVSDEWKATSYRASLTYQLNSNVMMYFSDSKGYSSGGFNGTAPPELRSYDPESLDNFEAGIKTEWTVGNTIGRTNLAAYFGKYEDIQVPVTQQVCDDAGNCTLAVVTENAATGEIQGVELEFAIAASDRIEFGLNGSWMDAEYTDYVSLDPATGEPVDLSSTAFVYLPEWKYNVFFTYHLPVNQDIGEMSFTANYAWQDEVVSTATPTPQFWDKTPAFDNLDLNLNWSDVLGTAGLTGTVFVTNVTENHWANGQFGAYVPLGMWGLTVAMPRSFGVRLRYDF